MRIPDKQGAYNKVWNINLEVRREEGAIDATVAAWLIDAPHAHPFWRHYMLYLVHLRPMPNCSPAIIYLEGATHELSLWAVNPEVKIEEEPFLRPSHLLSPGNFAAQIIADSDAAAFERVERDAVDAICAGTLNPDTDYISQWVKIFGNNMLRNK